MVNGIRTMVFTGKYHSKEKKRNEMSGIRTHHLSITLRKNKRKINKCEAWESNPRPLGSEGESKEMKEKKCEAWESNVRPPRQI